MVIDTDNPVVKLCIEGTQAKFRGEIEHARGLYQRAWELVKDDFEACIAAHYVARFQEDPQERFRWNETALRKAEAVGDERVDAFLPSLYLNMGQSHELLREVEEARRYYGLAAALGVEHGM